MKTTNHFVPKPNVSEMFWIVLRIQLHCYSLNMFIKLFCQVLKMLSKDYSATKKPLTEEEIEDRVLNVVKSYDKIVEEKVHLWTIINVFFSLFWFFPGCFVYVFVIWNRKSIAGNQPRKKTTRMWPSIGIIHPNNR